MPWTVSIAADTADVNIGTATATFRPADNSYQVTYTARLERNAGSIIAFVQAAKATLAAHQTQRATLKSAEGTIEGYLNA